MIYDFNSNPKSKHDLLQKHESTRTDQEVRNTPLSVYNLNNDDIKQAKRTAEEMLSVSGAEVNLYIRTDSNTIDRVWDEEADPTYWNKVRVKAYFKPQAFELELAKWGLDNKNKTDVVFSYLEIYDHFEDRLLMPGDVIQLPYGHIGGPQNYKITNVTPSGNFRYTWLYLSCSVEVLNVDMAVRPERDVTATIEHQEQRYMEHR